MHADAPKTCSGFSAEGEPACHALGADALAPVATSCGGTGEESCHRAGAKGTYEHENSDVHSPTSRAASRATFAGVACGACHQMSPNGSSLITEHDLATSEKTLVPSDGCRNCHNAPASTTAVIDEWPSGSTSFACEACHGRQGLDAVHAADVSGSHVSASDGCGSSGPGCHPTSDLSSVGEPTTSAGLHSDCLRCHDKSRAGASGGYQPDKKTCGSGRDCHTGYDPQTSSHEDHDGTDDAHRAGAEQRTALYRDPQTGIATACGACHNMALGTEHARSSVNHTWPNPCTGCHNSDLGRACREGELGNRRHRLRVRGMPPR